MQHGLGLHIRHVGGVATEYFIQLSEAECRRRREAISLRRGGLSEQRRQFAQRWRAARGPRPSSVRANLLPSMWHSDVPALPDEDRHRQRSPTLDDMFDAELQIEEFPEFPELAHVVHPSSPPPVVRYHASVQVGPETCDAATEARHLPVPLLAPLPISSADLAGRVSRYFAAHPSRPVDAIDNAVSGEVGLTLPQQRATQLAVAFGADLLREKANILICRLEDRFGSEPCVDPSVILRYLVEELATWARRPSLAREQAAMNVML